MCVVWCFVIALKYCSHFGDHLLLYTRLVSSGVSLGICLLAWLRPQTPRLAMFCSTKMAASASFANDDGFFIIFFIFAPCKPAGSAQYYPLALGATPNFPLDGDTLGEFLPGVR